LSRNGAAKNGRFRFAQPASRTHARSKPLAAPSQLNGFPGRVTVAAAAAVELMLNRAVAVPVRLRDEGFTPHVTLLEDVAHDKLTVPLKLFSAERFSPTVPEPPGANVICGSCGASAKSPTRCVTEMLATLLMEGA